MNRQRYNFFMTDQIRFLKSAFNGPEHPLQRLISTSVYTKLLLYNS